MPKSKAHPGFAAVQSKIEKSEGVSHAAAGRILGAAKAKASPAAKRANPHLLNTAQHPHHDHPALKATMARANREGC